MFTLTSPDFLHGQMMPVRCSCDGEDNSPALRWENPPAATKSFVLIMEDPDAPAGMWVHWLLYNIPSEKKSLEPAAPSEERLPDGGLQGRNSWYQIGYGGPCPPSGVHRYFFRLYALDDSLPLEAGVDKHTVVQAMQNHILAETELMGLFERNR